MIQNEADLMGVTLMRGDVEKEVSRLIEMIQAGNFASPFKPDQPISMAVRNLLGLDGKFGPTLDGVSEADKKAWADKILAACEGVDVPADILESLQRTAKKFDEKPASSPASDGLQVMRD